MTDEGYAGSAALSTDGGELTVQVRLSGRVEPVDGRYHWAGRIAPHEEVGQLFAAGLRSATLRIGDRDPVPVRLSEVDPWGAVRVTATSPPPWSMEHVGIGPSQRSQSMEHVGIDPSQRFQPNVGEDR